MKLRSFQQVQGYRFRLTFDSGEVMSIDLYTLIGTYVSEDQLKTAHLDSEWWCLEFNDGQVDIEPRTLYRFAHQQIEQEVA